MIIGILVSMGYRIYKKQENIHKYDIEYLENNKAKINDTIISRDSLIEFINNDLKKH